MSAYTSLVSGYRGLLRTLVRCGRRSRLEQAQQDAKKQIAVHTYRRMQLVREQQQVADPAERARINAQLAALAKNVQALKAAETGRSHELLFYPRAAELRALLLAPAEGPALERRAEHLAEVSGFVVNQHQYAELVERYNPGLRMSQEEKVKRTAAKVGLRVPDAE
ncbi:ADL224Cp [Eremothecium gossypii ATCC 10895]|uniref:ADL224Cp n=1 Tax=Eremothecium gossypii (strain ATCC 10895 / CBS 109.51 / FGSC 9923 / NRRL Y-1056) TaxID=284811 RepID=Q75AZ4_EREGS|nr:ADL224Cp [Eremothecium gossypii ATCC 10895]AAS51696.1 ADL224Cp [Eremothecium gossypii ATCC 10895]AEY95993.1 FADL224Cp [Eremothecium gossypii FDAG1]